ncbi:calpastatin isoform X2 [Rhinichthys klamathensis goyatoka]|uniref:calpastatin isoform X2 n=1 Tax=Rhinichthys klamathensis goyatoka TaxID=3034132 RepID=UPI0024B48824|nr:calpastatin isoform X2 [Rhinichthys klamathensis goyatoka]
MAYAAYWASIKGDTSLQTQACVPQTSRFQSQHVTPTSTSQVSSAKPAQYEKGPMQSSTASAAVKPGTSPATPAASSVAPSTVGAAGVGGSTTTQKAPSQVTPQATVSKPTPASSAKVPTASSATVPAGTTGGTGVKPTDPVKDKAQSTTVPSSKPGPAKVDPAVGKPSATAGAQKQTSAQKVQVEVGPPGTKVSTEDVDPFEALSGTLPSSKPLAPKVPTYTGPEVKELNVKPETGVLCGVRDDTLPPGYRKEDMEKKKPTGVPEKPKDVPKPMSTDDALESLSVGFVSSAPTIPKKTDVKTETIGAVDVRSAGISNFAPPPPYQPKQQATSQPATVTKSPAPPADKKAKLDIHTQPTKPKTDESDGSMSLDALSALGDTLGAPEPPKKLPELKPGQIVDEKKLTSEKGVRVGERDDTLPPDYRFSEEDLKKYPLPKKEPSLNTDDALDMLSEGFTAPAAAPVVKASVPPAQEKKKPDAVSEKTKDVPKETKKPAPVPEKTKDVPKHKVDELSALDALAGDFVAPPKSASKVSSAAPIPPGPPQRPQIDEDPFSALGDTLGAPEPPKKLPELKPGDIVHEKKLTSEKGVRVGERDDTLPPDYRFSEEELKKYPAPAKEPSLDTTDALDILSGDFTTPTVPSAAKTPVCSSSKTPVKPSGSDSDFALDALAGDFVAPSSASKVQSAVSGPPQAGRQLSESTSSALDALSDTLGDIKAAPEPAPVPPKAIVKEKDIKEEKVSKPGERDDTLPPDHRFREEGRKSSPQAFTAAKPKDVKPKQTLIDDTTALDMLSSDFSAVPTIKPSAPDARHFTPEPTPPTHKASGPVLDQMAGKLIPNLTDPKAKDSKPKAKGVKPKSKPKKQSVEDSSAMNQLPGKVSSDVVPSSSTKGGNR